MQKIFPLLLFLFAVAMASTATAQVSSYDELDVEEESISVPYKAARQNFVFLRSRRGTSGMNASPQADSVSGFPVTQIVLVFTELDADDELDREDANRERWENLIIAHPQVFQENTTYKAVCQCNPAGDAETFKKVQGFYIYYKGAGPPKAEAEKKVVESKPTESKVSEPVTGKKTTAAPAQKAAPEQEPEPVREIAKEPEPPAEIAGKPVKEKTDVTEEEKEEEEEKVVVKKKPAATGKPRKALDPKACRPACYEGGDEDLYAFFRDNIKLSKKQKKKAKNVVIQARIRVHFDGTIQKITVTGANETYNKMVQDALGSMGAWNAAVKNGTAIKSEVRLTIRYDKASQSLKPTDIFTNPRADKRCRCISDSEIF